MYRILSPCRCTMYTYTFSKKTVCVYMYVGTRWLRMFDVRFSDPWKMKAKIFFRWRKSTKFAEWILQNVYLQTLPTKWNRRLDHWGQAVPNWYTINIASFISRHFEQMKIDCHQWSVTACLNSLLLNENRTYFATWESWVRKNIQSLPGNSYTKMMSQEYPNAIIVTRNVTHGFRVKVRAVFIRYLNFKWIYM